ncbi:MAG: hypothetical protein EOO81_07385 [Oxalobacteraceae bacterium]|nr:MAG: hypothetical protein EOO81_07385 [Oxalobacteraceae bacterium]
MSSVILLTRKSLCDQCHGKRLSAKRIRDGVRTCATCSTNSPQRIELVVRLRLLQLVDPPPSITDDALLGGRGCDSESRRRPDLAWFGSDRAIFVEIDEDGGHPDRDPSEELEKVWTQTAAAKHLIGEHAVVFMLRFNPDVYDGPRHFNLEVRLRVLAADINRFCTQDLTEMEASVPHVGYYFYHSRAQHHIRAALAANNSLRVYRQADGDGADLGEYVGVVKGSAAKRARHDE